MAVLFITRPSPGTIPPGTAIAHQYYSELFEGRRDTVRSIPHETVNFEVRRRYLDVDFLREQVVIWNYVYTWTVCQARGRFGQDHSEMGPPRNLARETNDYQPAVLY